MKNGPKISDYFEIEYVTLPDFTREEANFKVKVGELRNRF